MSAKTCKIVIAPHVSRGPRATKRKTFEASPQGWKNALAHAKTGDTTIYLVCETNRLRVATCTEANERSSGAPCRLDTDLSKRR